MNNTLTVVLDQLPDVYESTKFNKQDLLVVLQGATGFIGGGVGTDPFSAVDAALSVIGNFATRCNTGTLQDIKDKIKKWLAFGRDYAALEDSSDLDFDTLDVESVPEVMKVRAVLCLYSERTAVCSRMMILLLFSSNSPPPSPPME